MHGITQSFLKYRSNLPRRNILGGENSRSTLIRIFPIPSMQRELLRRPIRVELEAAAERTSSVACRHEPVN